jgi:hypothetical protein
MFYSEVAVKTLQGKIFHLLITQRGATLQLNLLQHMIFSQFPLTC